MASILKRYDWVMLGAIAPIFMWSLLTLKSAGPEGDYFFTRQLMWIGISIVVFFLITTIDWRFFANSGVIIILYTAILLLLVILTLIGTRIKGAASWLDFSVASFQPSEAVKLVLILTLAKYFSRRHVDIARFRHIIFTGLYAAVPVAFIIMQPDLGTSLVILAIWLGMTLVSGIKLRHLALILSLGTFIGVIGWFFFLQPYQKDRITTFLNPAFDPKGAGYNAIQSMVAVGSGGFFGKGVGYGSQSRLQFLPEAQTDFIFAAFAEEWGLLGILLLLTCYGVIVWRVLKIGLQSSGNFPKLVAIGFTILLVVQGGAHIAMNMGMVPITGITLPFVSYGGSSLIIMMAGLGILQNMYARRDQFVSYRIEAADALL
jgi:rod shape determining protein RodA